MPDSKSRIDWERLDLSTDERVRNFAAQLEHGGREAVAAAIADHKAAGNPVYYSDPDESEVIIKEMPDGQRFQIRVDRDGNEVVVRSLPRAPAAIIRASVE